MAQSIKLLSTTNRVEAPFIEVNIGGYVFGKYSQKIERYTSSVDGFTRQVKETFPNYVKSLDVQKVNGQVNLYTLVLSYVIRAGEDPNKIDKILSSVSNTRKMIISYGDCNSPHYMYKDEEALITQVNQSMNIRASSITYTIQAVSQANLTTQTTHFFPAFDGKPSTKIREILYEQNNMYGLLDVFYGMRSEAAQVGLIDTGDATVHCDAKTTSPFDYLNYLVSCMYEDGEDGDDIQNRSKFFIACFDDTTGQYGGPYFKVKKVMKQNQVSSVVDTYEIDVGFPDADLVTNLQINTNDAYSLLYQFQGDLQDSEYTYRVNDFGDIEQQHSPNYLRDNTLYKSTESKKTWWAQMTQYPIQAEITIKGLLRPTLLMSYVRLNVYFYGRKHNSSGLYIITKQIDRIDESGYRSTLSLTRIGKDNSQ